MTLTGHWNRAKQKPYHIETRDGLLREEQKWKDALNHYTDVVGSYIESGGNVSRSRVSAFTIIVGVNLRELRSTREMRDILSAA
ncbi:MAG: hypothetical protein WA765_06050 [Candidatus Acidiferrum sp.]